MLVRDTFRFSNSSNSRLKQWFSPLVLALALGSYIHEAQALKVGEVAPPFTAPTTGGVIKFYEWSNNQYVLLFSHPQDFTPVCTTELARAHDLVGDFAALNTRLIGLSLNNLQNHERWVVDILKVAKKSGSTLNFIIIADNDLEVAKKYDMLSATEAGELGEDRSAQENRTARTVFLIGPDHKIRMTMTYPMTTGRNFDELLRVVKSVQLNDKYGVSTPADWQLGDDVLLSPKVSEADAIQNYKGLKVIDLPSKDVGKPDYLRYVKQPEEQVEGKREL